MTVWRLSVRALPVILAIVIVRALALNKIPKRTFSLLWGLALFVLLVPVQLRLPLSVPPLPFNEPEALMIFDHSVAQNGVVVTSPGLAISGWNNGPAVLDTKLAVNPWAKIIWMVVAGSMAVCFVANHIRYCLCYRFAVPCEDKTVQEWLQQNSLKRRRVKIKVSADISTALTYGVLRPVILLPKVTDWEDTTSLEYVLLHEMTHIRHYDTIWKWCLCAVLCAHWFNPLVWVMFVFANRDLELICDESVLKSIGASSKSEYALALIGLAEKQIKIMQFGMAFSKNAIEERILAIMKTKKVSRLATILAVALIVGVTVGSTAAGQAVTADKSPENVNDVPPNDSQTVEEATVISYTDPIDGMTYYSWDSGKTWVTMTNDEFLAASGLSDMEWWTEEEYSAWLEQEKINLQSCIGERGWTSSTGWFTWDQHMVDEAIALYEQTLNEIQNGMRVSKPFPDGNGLAVHFSRDEAGNGTESDDIGDYNNQDVVVHMTKYDSVGVMFLNHNGNIYWNDQLVHILVDQMPDGTSLTYRSLDEGGINIRTVYDNNGDLIAIEPVEE